MCYNKSMLLRRVSKILIILSLFNGDTALKHSLHKRDLFADRYVIRKE
jgi:hypothetical protein